MATNTNEWSVYRLFNKDKELLYIGIAKNVQKRVRCHIKMQIWGSEISHWTVDASKLEKRNALGFESRLIRKLRPKYNVLHNYQDEPPAVTEPLSSKERFKRWYAEFGMKHWYSFLFFLGVGNQQFEIPVFVLSPGNHSVFRWASKDGNQLIEVRPGPNGRATIHDKDVLIYLLAQLVNGERSGRPKSESRLFRIDVHNYLMSTQKMAGPGARSKLIAALNRLHDTTILMKAKTAGKEAQLEFGIIGSWAVIDSDIAQVPITIEVTVSDWVFQEFRKGKFFEIPYGYFQARSPVMRRIHELAGPHLAAAGVWTISVDKLLQMANPDSEHIDWDFPWISLIGSQILPGFRVNWDSINRVVRLRAKHTE